MTWSAKRPTSRLGFRLTPSRTPSIISGETRRLVSELFECAPVEAKPLKGFAMPMESWRVIKAERNRQPFQGAALRRTRRLSVESRRPTDGRVLGEAPKRETAASC